MPDQRGRYADALSQRVARAEAQRTALLAAIDSTRVARSLTFADDEHDPDGSTASLDQARDTALLQHAEQLLADLAAAQQRLSAGEYGSCEVCGGEISFDRLMARPETRTCIACAADRGDGRRRLDR